MTFEDLSRAVTAELATGSAGTPVSLRVHLSWPDPQCDLRATLDAILNLARLVFGCDADRRSVDVDAENRQLVALCRFPRGQTALVTLSRGSGPDRLFHLLVVGNRGVVRLEGGELLSAAP